MQDANLASGPSILDNVASTLSWENANAWADALVYAGHTNWRIPTTLNLDPSCSNHYPAQYLKTNNYIPGLSMMVILEKFLYQQLSGYLDQDYSEYLD
jgi:hypothetical protein